MTITDVNPGFTDEGAFSPDNLIVGGEQIQTFDRVLITGQNLVRGALLGRITASGKYNLSLSAAVDGSEVPVAILVQDTDATAADVVTPLYFSGSFNRRAITYGTAHTWDTVKEALAARGIFLKETVPA